MVRKLGVAVTAVLALMPSVARGAVTLDVPSSDRGRIQLVASARPALPDLRIVEVADGADVPVASTLPQPGPPFEDTNSTEAAPAWACDRRNRTFVAIGAGWRSLPVSVATPSCADRLRVQTPSTVAEGENLRVSIRDRWRLGDISARICVLQPFAIQDCEDASIPAAQFDTSRVYRALRPGYWVVTVTSGEETVSREIHVAAAAPASLPTVLTTGDSMMRNATDMLKPRLADRAHVVDDVYVGSGIARPFVVDWTTLPAKQVEAYRPDATVISLGMGDGRDLPTPSGPVACCGEAYVAEYAARVRQLMMTYARDGEGAVVWLDDPYPRDVSRAGVVTAVNQAVGRAAVDLDRVVVLDLAAVFTPDGTFRETLVRRGRTVKVRRPDGVHLTHAGARIAARLVNAELVRLGVISSPRIDRSRSRTVRPAPQTRLQSTVSEAGN